MSAAPLSGKNLVRLVYLDEAGTSYDEPYLCVAGVLVHGDEQWRQVDEKLDVITEKYIPLVDRLEFAFHATDIFHGSGYFNRLIWSRETRLHILYELADIIKSLHLPVVVGSYEKAPFGLGVLSDAALQHGPKRVMIQSMAAMNCVLWADRWLGTYAPTENGMVIAEDTDRVKGPIKDAVRVLRSNALLEKHELQEVRDYFDLPLKRIIDTVHVTAQVARE